MGLFGGKKKKNSVGRFDNSVLKCITERFETGDKVLAKHGYITVRDGIFRVSGENEDLFVCPENAVSCNELMSGDGVIVSGSDDKARERTLICYYLYYRKLTAD